MSFSRKQKETVRVKGTCAKWAGKCATALWRAGFVVNGSARELWSKGIAADDTMTPYRVRATYKSLFVSGQLDIDLVQLVGNRVEITVCAIGDLSGMFAWLVDPCPKLLDAFFREFEY